MQEQTILGFDPGSRKIGVAVGQTWLQHATPLERLVAHQGLSNQDEIKKLVQQWRPHILVVGLPTHMDGRKQFTTDLAVTLITFLQEITDLPVYSIDERLTTKTARSELFEQGGSKKLKKANVDSYAAKLIVESWMREQARESC